MSHAPCPFPAAFTFPNSSLLAMPRSIAKVSSIPRHTMHDPGTALSPLVPITVTHLPLRHPREIPVLQPAQGSPACG